MEARAAQALWYAGAAGKGGLGESPWFDPAATVRASTLGGWTAVGPRTSVLESVFGDYSYVGGDSSITYAEIGKFCSIAAHTCLNPGNHPLDRAALHHFTYRTRNYELGPEDDGEFFDWRRAHRVVLGHDVWVGHGAIVLPGVTVGTGAAVGAGAVVSRDVPPFSVAVGVPARVVRRRFPDPVVDGLLRVAWWDWPRERLADALEDFRTLDAAAFTARHDR